MKIKRVVLIVVASITMMFQVYAGNYQNIDRKIEQIKVGSSNLTFIKNLFGEPDHIKEGLEYYEYVEGKENKYFLNKEDARLYGMRKEIKRKLHSLSYSNLGIEFSFFDNPWRLYDMSIQKQGILIEGIEVGSSLSELENKLGEGSWESTESSDVVWYVYDDKGIRYGFIRDTNFQMFPVHLITPELVVKIEVFDINSSFVGR